MPLRLLLARYPNELSKVMGIIHRVISRHIVSRAGFSNKQVKTGAVTIRLRIARYLEKVDLVVRDMQNSYLHLPVDDEVSLLHLKGVSVSYRIAMRLQQG